jgi:hypothetical protein
VRETHFFFRVAPLVVSSDGSAVVGVGKVGKVRLPNIHNGVLSGSDSSSWRRASGLEIEDPGIASVSSSAVERNLKRN